jgi:actin-like ATPase involved in cell morphogenesis
VTPADTLVILGIDVGTTYTAAAIADGDRITPLTLGTRSFMIPSTVFVAGDGEVIVGDAAERRAIDDPSSVARGVKRRIGDETPMIVGGTPWPPELLFARLQRWVVDQARTDSGHAADKVVLTHPATWGQYRLEVLEQAARQAGIPDPTFVSEPAAAAAFHATETELAPGQVIIVYDFGGGTFDAAVLRKDDVGFTILGEPTGIDSIGGLNVDEAVLAFVDQAAGGVLADLDPDDAQVVSDVAELRRRCVAAKEALSTDMTATVAVRLPGRDVDVRITRDELRQMTSSIVAQTIVAVRRAMASANVAAANVSAVLLVGGSSQLPAVAEQLNELGLAVVAHPNPKLAVCEGAAVYGRTLFAPPPPPQAVAPAPAPTSAASWATTAAATAAAPTGPAPTAAPPPTAAPTAPPTPSAPPSPAAPRATAPAPTRSAGRLAARLAAAVFAVLTIVIALTGLGTNTTRSTSNGIAIGSEKVPSTDAAEVDLSKPFPVRFTNPALHPAAITVGVEVGPFSLFGSDPTPVADDNGVPTATVDLSGDRYLVGGRFTAVIALADANGQVLATDHIPARASGVGFATVSGVVICLLLLVVIAVIETLLRSLRRGGRVMPTLVARLTAVGAVGGMLIVGFVWLLHGPEPAIPTALVAAVTAGLAALLVGLSPRGRGAATGF